MNINNNCTEYKTWLCEYQFDGEIYGFEISAKSLQEAKLRLQQISQGRVLGSLEGTLEVTGASDGWRAKLTGKISEIVVVFLNLFS